MTSVQLTSRAFLMGSAALLGLAAQPALAQVQEQQPRADLDPERAPTGTPRRRPLAVSAGSPPPRPLDPRTVTSVRDGSVSEPRGTMVRQATVDERRDR